MQVLRKPVDGAGLLNNPIWAIGCGQRPVACFGGCSKATRVHRMYGSSLGPIQGLYLGAHFT